MAFVTNKAERNTENKEEISPKIPKPLVSAALQTEAQQACGCEERAWVPPYLGSSHFAAPKTHTSTSDLNRGGSHPSQRSVSSVHAISTISTVFSCAAAGSSRVGLFAHGNNPWPAGRQANRARCDLKPLSGQAGHCSVSPESDLGCKAGTR